MVSISKKQALPASRFWYHLLAGSGIMGRTARNGLVS
jgi:hypothetical protein